MEIKVIITCHYKPIQMAKIKKKTDKTKSWPKVCDTASFRHCFGNLKYDGHSRKYFENFIKIVYVKL